MEKNEGGRGVRVVGGKAGRKKEQGRCRGKKTTLRLSSTRKCSVRLEKKPLSNIRTEDTDMKTNTEKCNDEEREAWNGPV